MNIMKAKNIFYLMYWLPMQSKILSEPNVFTTPEKEKLHQAIATAKQSGYQIESYGLLLIPDSGNPVNATGSIQVCKSRKKYKAILTK